MIAVTRKPELFKTLENGKVRSWSISVMKSSDGKCFIETTHGYVDGKLQTDTVEITHGTNVGKKNEQSIEQKAIFDSEKKWKDKIEKHQYTENVLSQVKKFTPMLAIVYNPQKVNFPCFVQPKLDGVRCAVYIKNGTLIAESRTGKEFQSCSHILQELKFIFKENPELILDGELYSDTLCFEELVGLVKTQKSQDDPCQFSYYIYDLYENMDMTFRERFVSNSFLQCVHPLLFTKIVHTMECKSPEEIQVAHIGNKKKFEGSIIRNNAPYEQKRSVNLMKLKDKHEHEFIIVGYKEGKGREKGQVIWECKTESGEIFQCRPMGTKENRELLYLNAEKYLNSTYTVMYQELTKKGVPRFPVGKCCRDYE